MAVLVYLGMKVVGSKYVVTNRVVKRVNSMGIGTHQETVPLSQIITASVDPDSRMSFYLTGRCSTDRRQADNLYFFCEVSQGPIVSTR